MTEAPDFLTRSTAPADAYAANLLHFYGFELGERTIAELVAQWQATYPESWVRLAVIEALYQGRYKAISVEQILAFWQRRQQPLHRFTHDFERLICNKLPRNLAPLSSGQPPRSRSTAAFEEMRPPQARPNNVLNFPTPAQRTSRTAVEESKSDRITAQLEAPIQADEIRADELANSEAETPAPAPRPEVTRILSVLEEVSGPASAEQEAIDPASNTANPPTAAKSPLLPNFGLTPPQLSFKLKVQLASLYQPNWIVQAKDKHPLYRFAPALRRFTEFPAPAQIPATQSSDRPRSNSSLPDRSSPDLDLPDRTIALAQASATEFAAVPDPWSD